MKRRGKLRKDGRGKKATGEPKMRPGSPSRCKRPNKKKENKVKREKRKREERAREIEKTEEKEETEKETKQSPSTPRRNRRDQLLTRKIKKRRDYYKDK